MLDTRPGAERVREESFGKYVAWLGDEEVLSAETCDDLMDGLQEVGFDESKVVIGWEPRPDVFRLGFGLYAVVPIDMNPEALRSTETIE